MEQKKQEQIGKLKKIGKVWFFLYRNVPEDFRKALQDFINIL